MAKGLTFLKAARQIIIVTNVVFFILGLVMLVIAAIGITKDKSMKQKTDVMDSLNLGMLTWIIVAAASATIVTSFIGLVGAYLKNMLMLKLYVVLVLITFVTQIAIGAYMLNLDMSSLRTYWEQDDKEGGTRRENLQKFLSCCGFDRWSDSMGTLKTECNQLPTYANGYAEPQACYPAAQKFVHDWLNPIAIAAIAIGCVESIAMCITFALVFQSKDINSDTAFDY